MARLYTHTPIQKSVAESKGRDLCYFVVVGKVVVAIRRATEKDEFHSNVHRGGQVESGQISPQYEATAILAAQILGLSVAGVDLFEENEGPQVREVNSSPGLEGIEKATNADITGAVMQHLEEEANYPNVDIRQCLVDVSA